MAAISSIMDRLYAYIIRVQEREIAERCSQPICELFTGWLLLIPRKRCTGIYERRGVC